MPNDAKIGLVIGVGLVIAVAVLFYRKDAGTDGKSPTGAAARPNRVRTAAARPVSRTRASSPAEPRRHAVAEGETLYTIAEAYYGDGERFVDLYDGNRDVLKRPDRLETGTVLVIPD